jgi:hypothetical protein
LAVVAGGFTVYAAWPSEPIWQADPAGGAEPLGFWFWLWSVLLALTYGALVLGLVVTIVLPVLLGLVWEAMVVRVTRDRGLATPGEGVMAGASSALAVLLRTMPTRLGWWLAAVIATFVFPPVAPLLTWFGQGLVMVIDGQDLALAVRGYDGQARLRFLRENRWSNWLAGGCTGVVGFGLSLTVIGLPLLTPLVYLGAAAGLSAEGSAPVPAGDDEAASEAAANDRGQG